MKEDLLPWINGHLKTPISTLQDLNLNITHEVVEAISKKRIISEENLTARAQTLLDAVSERHDCTYLGITANGIKMRFHTLELSCSSAIQVSLLKFLCADKSKRTKTPQLLSLIPMDSPITPLDSPMYQSVSSPMCPESPVELMSPRQSLIFCTINSMNIALYDDYFPKIEDKEALNRKASGKLKIVHTQFNQLQLSSKSEKKELRKSHSFNISNSASGIYDLQGKNQENLIATVRSLFTNEDVFLKLKIESSFYDNLKLLFKCVYFPRVLYASLPEDERTYYLKRAKLLIQEPRLLAKVLKCIPLQSEEGLAFLKAIDGLDMSRYSMEEALELLSDPRSNVRSIGLRIMEHVDITQVELFLFFIIQAIRFENVQDLKSHKSKLSNYLIQIAGKSTSILVKLYWYLVVETNGEKKSNLPFRYVFHSLQEKFKGSSTWNLILRQDKFVVSLTKISKYLSTLQNDRPEKVLVLNQILENAALINLPKWGDIFGGDFYLPLDPSRKVSCIEKGSGKIFKSQLAPLLLSFGSYSVIFKRGDDLRQDQLILLAIRFMNDCLLSKNLDLHLTPYHIWPTSQDTGFLECVDDSITIGTLLREYPAGIHEYFLKHNSINGAIDKKVITRYLKSCAGYSVITYILGIGDRHLDNILVTKNGNFFHIDFGFIMGQDPKPFPPKMRLSKEMIDGMGGAKSTEFVQFKILCCEAFKILRKFSNYILTMLNSLISAQLPHLTTEALQNVVTTNFKLDLNDHDANDYMIKLIDDTLTLLMPRVTEKFHELAQYVKK